MSLDLTQNIRHYGFKRLLLAVSGGLDSICLAHYFICNKENLGIEWIGIAHVHHGLREKTADRDATFVEAFARKYNVPFFLKKLDGEALKNAEGSLEENAREARYKALMDTLATTWPRCDDAAIVTAHHAGDLAETMYMRLRRGTTLAGLRGIQETRMLSSTILYRPFLNVTHGELLAYARENGLAWCEDESNDDVKFARNMARHKQLPHLEETCPGATEQLCRLAGLAEKAYAKVVARCETLFAPTLAPNALPSEMANCMDSGHEASRMTSLDKKKLNRILREHADANLSEMFRLWLSELGFRFPIGFFYSDSEPAHVKIPVRATYRKRSIVKIAHTIWICAFKSPEAAQKFVSCGLKEKGL